MNLTVPPNKFSIDSVPTKVEWHVFDGCDSVLPKIEFVNPDTGESTDERSALVHIFAFNGTALLTPSAWDKECHNLKIDNIDRGRLDGSLLVLDLDIGVTYGREEIQRLLCDEPRKNIEENIVLLRTKLMQRVLATADERGVPDYDALAETQKNRPGLTPDGAMELQEIKPRAIMIDNISFEPNNGIPGFHATQRLAHPKGSEFTPLIYHVGNTGDSDFKNKYNGKSVRIELGNPPENLSGYPVGVYVA